MQTSASFDVRPAKSGDATSLANLFGQLGFPCSSHDVAGRIEAGRDIALVAVSQERVVGVVTVNVMPVLHRPCPVGRISALVVDRNARGCGLGTVLVAAAESMLAASGCELVEVTSNFRLEQAHGFYKSLGYEATSYRFKKEIDAQSDRLDAARPLAGG